MGKIRPPAPSPPPLFLGTPAPPGLRMSRLPVGDTEVVVLSYPAPQAPRHELTASERDVARLLLAGHEIAAIATLRGTTRSTVSKQVDAVYKKLGMHSRAELAARLGSSASAPAESVTPGRRDRSGPSQPGRAG